MAIQNSTQYAAQIAIPPTKVDAAVQYGKLRVYQINFTQSGAGTIGDSARLIKLPQGKVVVYGLQSFLVCGGWSASTTLNLGFEAYKGAVPVSGSNPTVAAVPAAFASAISIATTNTAFAWWNAAAAATNPGGVLAFESINGVVLAGVINGAAPAASATLQGSLVCGVE
jgi:hypothetical protein